MTDVGFEVLVHMVRSPIKPRCSSSVLPSLFCFKF